MNKILLAIQFWANDKADAMRMARFVADLEPEHSKLADFLFCARFDCTNDPATVAYVSSKFNTFTYVNKNRRAEGWPFGCNELFFGMVDHVFTQIEAKKMPQYKAVLAFEADGNPMCADWISQLHANWDKFHAKGAHMVGALIPPGPKETDGKHINGNCLVDAGQEYLHWIARKIGGCRPTAGWDWVLAPTFKAAGWANCPGMRSFWRSPPMPRQVFDRLRKEGVFFVHGIKDSSIIDHVRKDMVG
jgi:hypothetical protein